MATDSTELERFRRFVDKKLAGGRQDFSLAETVAEFEAYEAEVACLGEAMQESIDQANRGEAKPLDSDALKKEIRDELAEEGIRE